jgi:cobalt-zinc-cadmium resistance protein CzcA
MIDRLVSFCLDKRLVVMLLAVFAAIYGYYSWTQLAVEAYPDIADVTAQVTTQAPGLAAEEVEQQITVPLERSLAGTPGLSTLRSSSTFGLSLITMVFRDGAEDYWERQRVMERVSQVSLPPGLTPGLDPVSSPVGEIYRYTLESDSKNLMDLSEIQRWIVIPALQQVPGITNVDNFGGFTKLFQLELDPAELTRYGLSLNDVITAITNNSANAGGGRITRGEQAYVIRGIGMVHSLDDLGSIVVTQSNGSPVLVRELGTLQFGHQEREGILGKDTNPDTIEGICELLKGENASVVLKSLHAKVAELQKKLAPMDVRIVPYIDRDELVQATISKVGHTVVEGIGLVCIVLILFLGSPRAAMVVAVTIPLALVSVFVIMNLTKMPANLFSLGAIDFGIIVDGAVVVTEALLRRREAAPNRELDTDEIKETAQQVIRPIFFATLIIITAYFPLFAFERAEAKLFSPMAYAVGYALFGALLCTLTLVPGLAYLAFRKPRPIFHNRPLNWLQARYQWLLGHLVDAPRVTLLIVGTTLAAVLLLGLTVGREFLPDLDEGALWLQVSLPTGLSLEQASTFADELRRTVRSFPETSYAVTQLGRSDDQTDPWTPSHIEAGVGLTRYDQWPDHESKAEFIRRLNAKFKELPGFDIGISQPIIDGVNDMVGGAHSPLAIRVFGEDFKELRRIADGIVDVLKATRGTADASIFQEPPIPQMVIDVDRAEAARYGINVADIATLIQTGIAGVPIGQVYVADRVYGISVRFPPIARHDPESLGNLFLTAMGGAKIPLAQLATIRLQNGESTITHERNRRNLTVRIDLRDRDLTSYLDEVQKKIAGTMHFDTSKYEIEWAGQFENQRRAETRLSLILALVLGLMLLLLYAGFGRFRQALLILGVVPLATLGGLISLHVTGETLNVATAVGFIALFGVSVQNGIIMVANLNRLRETEPRLRNAVLAGAAERFRPVLMTATVATVGMLPAAIATGVGSDVQRGLATVVVGGLVVATLLTLFILPACYFFVESYVERRNPPPELDEDEQEEWE